MIPGRRTPAPSSSAKPARSAAPLHSKCLGGGPEVGCIAGKARDAGGDNCRSALYRYRVGGGAADGEGAGSSVIETPLSTRRRRAAGSAKPITRGRPVFLAGQCGTGGLAAPGGDHTLGLALGSRLQFVFRGRGQDAGAQIEVRFISYTMTITRWCGTTCLMVRAYSIV
ncbi:hypothetical protein H4W80_002491 [Nonomuraea angiospora]|uniref:Uncharacterized protein n=1 Tax=Nonomuraea angiospora TaxID=46172 RepID=A0ABR9LVE0_9ACTN|nr:hypothetical protein [Nonomuraea angiospora]